MKSEHYLNETGQRYFKAIAGILKERGMDQNAFGIELSRLANQYSLYEEVNKKARQREEEGKPGFYNEFDNHTVQVNAFFTISEKCSASIDKLGAKFGLTPQDFERIKDAVKKEEKKKPIDQL